MPRKLNTPQCYAEKFIFFKHHLPEFISSSESYQMAPNPSFGLQSNRNDPAPLFKSPLDSEPTLAAKRNTNGEMPNRWLDRCLHSDLEQDSFDRTSTYHQACRSAGPGSPFAIFSNSRANTKPSQSVMAYVVIKGE